MISNALQQLYDEHEIILRELDRMHALLRSPDLSQHAAALQSCIKFFREYGDGLHHHKEELALFPRLLAANQSVATIIDSLADHHVLFREALQRAEAALAAKEWTKVEETLRSYAVNLIDHISAENDELFVAADELLSDSEKETMNFLFLDEDRAFGEERKRFFEQDAIHA